MIEPALPEWITTERFAQSRWTFPYRGVVSQFREKRQRQSTHVLVYRDGVVETHVDSYNPDMGHPIRHFIFDTPVGRGALMACCIVAARRFI